MAFFPGLKAVAYELTSTGPNVWTPRQNMTSVTIGGEKARADVTTRGGNGFRQEIGTLKEGEVSFDIIYDDNDTFFDKLDSLDRLGGTVDMAFAAKSIGTTGSWVNGVRAFRSEFSLVNFSEAQELEDVLRYSVTLAVSFSSGGTVTPGYYESDDGDFTLSTVS